MKRKESEERRSTKTRRNAQRPGTPAIFYRKARAGGDQYSRYRLRPARFRQPGFSRTPHVFRDRWRTYRCRQARSFHRLRLSKPDLPTQPLPPSSPSNSERHREWIATFERYFELNLLWSRSRRVPARRRHHLRKTKAASRHLWTPQLWTIARPDPERLAQFSSPLPISSR